MPEFLLRQSGTWKALVVKVLTQTGIKVGQKRHERKSKKCLPVLLPPWPKASLPSPEANGNHALSLKLWRGLKSWISLPLQDTITLLFVWQDKQQDKRRGARVGYSESCWSGTMTKTGPWKHCAGLRHLRQAVEEQLCIDEDKKSECS